MHGLIFETSVCYWQNQPGCYLYFQKEIVMLQVQPITYSNSNRNSNSNARQTTLGTGTVQLLSNLETVQVRLELSKRLLEELYN
jgi:hypothetical protein